MGAQMELSIKLAHKISIPLSLSTTCLARDPAGAGAGAVVYPCNPAVRVLVRRGVPGAGAEGGQD